MKFLKHSLISVLIVVLCCGCSNKGGDPATPPVDDQLVARSGLSEPGHILIGPWNVTIDPDDLTAEVTPPSDVFSIYDIKINPSWNDSFIVSFHMSFTNPTDDTYYDPRCIVYVDSFTQILLNADEYTAFEEQTPNKINPFIAFHKKKLFEGDLIRTIGPYQSLTEEFHIQTPVDPDPNFDIAITVHYPGHCAEPMFIRTKWQTPTDAVGPDPTLHYEVYFDVGVYDDDEVTEAWVMVPRFSGLDWIEASHKDYLTWHAVIDANEDPPWFPENAQYTAWFKAKVDGGSEFLYDRMTFNTLIYHEANGYFPEPIFAEPESSEINDVRWMWQSRNRDWQFVSMFKAIDDRGTALDTDDIWLYVIGHTMNTPGPAGIHYGAVLVPPHIWDQEEPQPPPIVDYPILVLAHGNRDEFTVSTDDFYDDNGDPDSIYNNFIQVLPTYRGEYLDIGEDFVWEIPPPPEISIPILSGPEGGLGGWSPHDWDVDDTMGLLQVALDLPELAEIADGTRVAIRGASRGGGVALLAGARDDIFDRVIDVYGITDFFTIDVQFQAGWLYHFYADELGVALDPIRKSYDQNPLKGTGMYARWQIIIPYITGEGGFSLPHARSRLIRYSAKYFLNPVNPSLPDPFFQVHHGTYDFMVPKNQSRVLMLDSQYLPDSGPWFYQGAGHSMYNQEKRCLNEFPVGLFSERIKEFLTPLANLPD